MKVPYARESIVIKHPRQAMSLANKSDKALGRKQERRYTFYHEHELGI